jgi:hypothetical protein
VFRLGPESQKGVETRLRRLSAPLIPAGTTYQQVRIVHRLCCCAGCWQACLLA